MAAYNGEKYIADQLDSILKQISLQDELIVSLDPCRDGTRQILLDYQKEHPNLKIFRGPGRGIMNNFENGLRKASGDIIFLCDQDDVWAENKVESVKKAFENPQVLLVMHDCAITDEKLHITKDSYYAFHKSSPSFAANILRNSYVGACMAFRRELLAHVLPFPQNVAMHDQWIGLVASRHGKVKWLPDCLLYYRRHPQNASPIQPSIRKVKLMFAQRRQLILTLKRKGIV